jgi:short-subunit dehydrogenase
MHSKSILELSPEEVDLTLRVNLLSHWHTVKACLPGMLDEERGTIVTIASVLGYLGCPNLCKHTLATTIVPR